MKRAQGISIRIRQGQSIRALQARIQYDPEWSKDAPFKTYWRGSAGPVFRTLRQALDHFTFITPSEWSDPA